MFYKPFNLLLVIFLSMHIAVPLCASQDVAQLSYSELARFADVGLSNTLELDGQLKMIEELINIRNASQKSTFLTYHEINSGNLASLICSGLIFQHIANYGDSEKERIEPLIEKHFDRGQYSVDALKTFLNQEFDYSPIDPQQPPNALLIDMLYTIRPDEMTKIGDNNAINADKLAGLSLSTFTPIRSDSNNTPVSSGPIELVSNNFLARKIEICAKFLIPIYQMQYTKSGRREANELLKSQMQKEITGEDVFVFGNPQVQKNIRRQIYHSIVPFVIKNLSDRGERILSSAQGYAIYRDNPNNAVDELRKIYKKKSKGVDLVISDFSKEYLSSGWQWLIQYDNGIQSKKLIFPILRGKQKVAVLQEGMTKGEILVSVRKERTVLPWVYIENVKTQEIMIPQQANIIIDPETIIGVSITIREGSGLETGGCLGLFHSKKSRIPLFNFELDKIAKKDQGKVAIKVAQDTYHAWLLNNNNEKQSYLGQLEITNEPGKEYQLPNTASIP